MAVFPTAMPARFSSSTSKAAVPRRNQSGDAARLTQCVVERDVVGDVRFRFRVQNRCSKESEICGLRAEYPTNARAKSACQYRSIRRERISPGRVRLNRRSAAESASVRLPVSLTIAKRSSQLQQSQINVLCVAVRDLRIRYYQSPFDVSRYFPLIGSTNWPSIKF